MQGIYKKLWNHFATKIVKKKTLPFCRWRPDNNSLVNLLRWQPGLLLAVITWTSWSSFSSHCWSVCWSVSTSSLWRSAAVWRIWGRRGRGAAWPRGRWGPSPASCSAPRRNQTDWTARQSSPEIRKMLEQVCKVVDVVTWKPRAYIFSSISSVKRTTKNMLVISWNCSSQSGWL